MTGYQLDLQPVPQRFPSPAQRCIHVASGTENRIDSDRNKKRPLHKDDQSANSLSAGGWRAEGFPYREERHNKSTYP